MWIIKMRVDMFYLGFDFRHIIGEIDIYREARYRLASGRLAPAHSIVVQSAELFVDSFDRVNTVEPTIIELPCLKKNQQQP